MSLTFLEARKAYRYSQLSSWLFRLRNRISIRVSFRVRVRFRVWFRVVRASQYYSKLPPPQTLRLSVNSHPPPVVKVVL